MPGPDGAVQWGGAHATARAGVADANERGHPASAAVPTNAVSAGGAALLPAGVAVAVADDAGQDSAPDTGDVTEVAVSAAAAEPAEHLAAEAVRDWQQHQDEERRKVAGTPRPQLPRAQALATASFAALQASLAVLTQPPRTRCMGDCREVRRQATRAARLPTPPSPQSPECRCRRRIDFLSIFLM